MLSVSWESSGDILCIYNQIWTFDLLLFFKNVICLLLERGDGKEKEMEEERERNIDVWDTHVSVASRTPPTGDLAQNPGICPDWKSNLRPFRSQAGAQSTGLLLLSLIPFCPPLPPHLLWTVGLHSTLLYISANFPSKFPSSNLKDFHTTQEGVHQESYLAQSLGPWEIHLLPRTPSCYALGPQLLLTHPHTGAKEPKPNPALFKEIWNVRAHTAHTLFCLHVLVYGAQVKNIQ